MAVNEDIPLSRVINVSITGAGRQLDRTNMNIVSIITSELGVLSTANRTEVYTSLASVASDFGTNSNLYQFAKVLFAGSANPINRGGYLVAGFWRAVDENVGATYGNLLSAELSQAIAVQSLQNIQDGSFDITIDGGTAQNITALDFRTISDLGDIVSILNTAITDATVTLDNNQIVVTSDTTGATSAVTAITEGASGTFVGDVLSLSGGSGAVVTDGVDATVLTAETKEDAIIAISEEEPIRGVVYVDKPTSSEAEELSSWGLANDVIVYDVFSDSDDFAKDVTNFVWSNKISAGYNYRTLFDKAGDRKLASAYMSRLHTVNFNADNTAITMHLKELSGVTPSKFSDSELNDAQTVGLDLYGTFGGLPKLYTSGANDFVDNVYNNIAVKRFVQIDLFNLLGSTTTKLAQTDKDMAKIVARVERTMDLFVSAGVIAPGRWNSPDDFGNPEVFRRSIEAKGYFVYANPMSGQAQSEREQRVAPVVQVAFKLAGAIHSVDVQLIFER